MITVQEIDPHRDRRWMAYLERHPGATVFHHPAWIRTLQESYGYASQSLALISEKSVAGILPLLEIRSPLTGFRAVSLPFSDQCAPLLDSPELGAAFLEHCDGLARQRRWKYVEFRGQIDGKAGGPSAHFKVHSLDLRAGQQKIFDAIRRENVGRSVLKGMREGVAFEKREDEEGLAEFVRLNARTRRKHGLPPQPDRYFRRFSENLIRGGLGFIGLARREGKVIGACVYLCYGKTVVYKYGASDERALQYRPNHVVMWEAIRWAADNGYERFDFGRTDLDAGGLLQFKRGWGSTEGDLMYFRLGQAGDVGSGAQGRTIARLKPLITRLPIPLLKFLGRGLYGHIG